MSDLPPDDSPTNATEFTVSEISGALKRVVEDAFGNVRVRGEISGYRGPHSSGHAYFSLKDDRARIEAVVWRASFGRLKFKPEEGMEVIATGKLTTYAGSSKYQIVIEQIEPAGAGALMAMLEERRRKLEAEGLFAAERKRPLPYMPGVIGVITSPTGAVIRDIIHRITDRFPLHVIVWPVRVQGETAGPEVAAAVEGFNALEPGGPIAKPDILIVARGGGSLEDLWGFNDEIVVRAVAASGIPVISAVGHETDWTLIDHAADMRAPTPTGAAELAVPVKAELEATVASLSARLRGCMSRSADRKREALRAAARALPSADQLLAIPRRRFDEASSRLGRGLEVAVERKASRLGRARLSPASLERRIVEARRRLAREGDQLPKCADALLRTRRTGLRQAAARLRIEPVAALAQAGRQSLSVATKRMDTAVTAGTERARARWAQAARLSESLSYKAVLGRGYAVVRDSDGMVKKHAADIDSGEHLRIEFADGETEAIAAGAGVSKPKAPPAKKPKGPQSQGNLF
ncbi:MAG: exodeoxyribonuclease VII large subunit [Rhizobiaceae bacterium]